MRKSGEAPTRDEVDEFRGELGAQLGEVHLTLRRAIGGKDRWAESQSNNHFLLLPLSRTASIVASPRPQCDSTNAACSSSGVERRAQRPEMDLPTVAIRSSRAACEQRRRRARRLLLSQRTQWQP